jgi:uncharacterized membrane protein YeaQ/YmgE (transglycosylase-associated protein family)
MFHIIGFIITGFIVGLIARALHPGNDRMGWLTTTGLGILGALIAGWIGRAVGWYGPRDSAGFVASTVGAIILLVIAHLAFGRRRVDVT